MSKPTPLTRPEMAKITQARLTFANQGRALSTAASLDFAMDHAKARMAVLSELDTNRLGTDLVALGLKHTCVQSMARNRQDFIQRPDLGRQLHKDSFTVLGGQAPMDVAMVLGDGLSAMAVALNGPAFVAGLTEALANVGLRVGPVILARQARVALADKIAIALKADTVVMVLGERPGLSAADGLGVYLTQHPSADTPDSARNCLSNIREAGLAVPDAVQQATKLVLAMRKFGKSGVALNQNLGTANLLSND